MTRHDKRYVGIEGDLPHRDPVFTIVRKTRDEVINKGEKGCGSPRERDDITKRFQRDRSQKDLNSYLFKITNILKEKSVRESITTTTTRSLT